MQTLLTSLGSDLKVGDLAGSILERFRSATSKVANLSFDPQKSSWEEVIGLFEVRNCLVHAGGNLAEFSKASVIRAFASRHAAPKILNEIMLIDSDMSKLALAIASAFLNEIYRVALETFPTDNA